METTPMKKKKEKKSETFSTCVNISFHLSSLGVDSSYLKWENLFFISRSYLLGVFSSSYVFSQTTKLLFLLQLMMSRKCAGFLEVSFYLLERETKKNNLEEMTAKAFGAIKSKHLSWHKRGTRDRNQTTILAREMKIVAFLSSRNGGTPMTAIKSFYCLLTISLWP
jgi:hypothetical protein